jgi:hypothetical protein
MKETVMDVLLLYSVGRIRGTFTAAILEVRKLVKLNVNLFDR